MGRLIIRSPEVYSGPLMTSWRLDMYVMDQVACSRVKDHLASILCPVDCLLKTRQPINCWAAFGGNELIYVADDTCPFTASDESVRRRTTDRGYGTR